MLTPKQYASDIGRPYPTVMTWLQRGLIAEAEKHDTPTGHYWLIPKGTEPPDLKPGVKPGTKRKKKGGKKKPSVN